MSQISIGRHRGRIALDISTETRTIYLTPEEARDIVGAINAMRYDIIERDVDNSTLGWRHFPIRNEP